MEKLLMAAALSEKRLIISYRLCVIKKSPLFIERAGLIIFSQA